jgi:hypothetical protein
VPDAIWNQKLAFIVNGSAATTIIGSAPGRGIVSGYPAPTNTIVRCTPKETAELIVRWDRDNGPKVEAHRYDVKASVTHCSTIVQSIARTMIRPLPTRLENLRVKGNGVQSAAARRCKFVRLRAGRYEYRRTT